VKTIAHGFNEFYQQVNHIFTIPTVFATKLQPHIQFEPEFQYDDDFDGQNDKTDADATELHDFSERAAIDGMFRVDLGNDAGEKTVADLDGQSENI